MYNKVISSSLVKNMSWGVLSNILQIGFVLGFFVIIARKFSPEQFGTFLISSTVYQIVAAFSSLGLGQWFIRQYSSELDKCGFTAIFLKTQAGLGVLFYLGNIAIAYMLYDDPQIRMLSIILGTNILFDNLINAIKSLNIAENEQRKTAVILSVDGLLKLLSGCVLFFYPISATTLAFVMVIARILTLGVFINMGTSGSIDIKTVISAYVSFEELKRQVLRNWRFIVIGGISIIYWRIGNIIISKMLAMADVVNYEIAFRILSVLIILPVVASATIYPRFISYFTTNNLQALKQFYQNLFRVYTLFSILTYATVFCFADLLVPLLFGKAYPEAIACVKEMFLTYLLFPSVLLQANLLVAMGKEKLDMWFNILSLVVNVLACIIGLYFIKDLAVINYSVLFSFVVFHLLQDGALIRNKITTAAECLVFYAALITTVLGFHYVSSFFSLHLTFGIFICLLTVGGLIWYRYKRQSFSGLPMTLTHEL